MDSYNKENRTHYPQSSPLVQWREICMSNEKLTQEEELQRNEMIRCNRLVANCQLITCSIISVTYILEFVKGAHSLPYILIVLALALITPIAQQIILKANPASTAIAHLLSIGYGAFYTFILLTATNNLVFVYVLPMFIVVLVYNDWKFIMKVAFACVGVNIVQIIVFLANGTYTMAENSVAIEIQLLVMVIISIYMTFVARLMQKNSDIRVDVIAEQSRKTEKTMALTLDVSNKMAENITTVGGKMLELNDAANTTKESMGEVNAGDTAEAVQRQITLTGNIQTRVDEVQEGTDLILSSVQNAEQAVREGSRNINALVSQVEDSISSGKEVTRQLGELQANMERISSVVDMIGSIAQQTSMLSLNASIEAARAGESGKGFAVVATEMTKMADETGQATSQIASMLDEFSSTITNVVKVTTDMIDKIDAQHASTEAAAKSFESIAESSGSIANASSELRTGVMNLAEANKEIVDSISTISSISEEVAAHANTTFDISEKNADTVAEITNLIGVLSELADELK